MRVPQRPPDTGRSLAHAVSADRLREILAATEGVHARGKYLHWDELRRRSVPTGLSVEEWWLGLKLYRRSLAKAVPLCDRGGKPFQYLLPDPIPEGLHEIDLGAGGLIPLPGQITNPHTRDRYYVNSLIEEAITSSQLEGATTTRRVAKEMLRSARPPRNRSERMILNNFLTMRRIGELKNEPLTPELVFEIHRLVTDQTLDDPTGAGRFRRPDETVSVQDVYGEVLHTPPPAATLEGRMAELCAFANGETPSGFLHPVVRSIILHFWLGYDHPFVDGNGRTARALFYWSMLRSRFWLFEFVSISTIINSAPVKYATAYLHTETDDNDLTYFLIYHVDVIRRAIRQLHEYIDRKASEVEAIEDRLRGMRLLNHRQRALMSHALRHPQQRYTFESHRTSHNVAYQTARTDLLGLQEKGLVEAQKIGAVWTFTPASDLEARLAMLK
jgi:Fic family protein